MSGAEQTRKSWRYPGDKLNRNLLGRTSGLSTRARAEPRSRSQLARPAGPRGANCGGDMRQTCFSAFAEPIIEEAPVANWIPNNIADRLVARAGQRPMFPLGKRKETFYFPFIFYI